jgi:hypothetical protein
VTLKETRPELCQCAARHKEQLFQCLFAEQLSRANLFAEQLSQQSFSYRLAQSFITGRLFILPSDSLIDQITCRATLPAVFLLPTRPELYHWPARHEEQLFPATACRATLSPTKLPAEQLSQQSFSYRLAQSFLTGRLFMGCNSSSVSQTK